MLYLRALLLCLAIFVPLSSRLAETSLLSGLRLAVLLELQYLLGLFGSILLYRLSPLHRLHHFSGPLLWRVTKLFHAYDNRDFDGFRHLYAAHRKYGDYVRTGPSELSIVDPDAIGAVYGTASKCTRAAWYSMAYPLRAIFHTRDKTEHEKRRQVWSQGLSAKALKAYEVRIEGYISRLIHQLHRKAEEKEAVNVSQWFNFFSFDVMGEVGFSKSFGMLEIGERLQVLRILMDGQKGLGVFGVVPWLFMLLTKLPWISKEHDTFVQWCEQQMLDRKLRQTDDCDIAATLIEDDLRAKSSAISRQWLAGDSRILIVAGSDAVASSLVFASYYLAKNPKHIAVIREELGGLARPLSAATLQTGAPHLNAFITEVLRLWPPNPSGVLRQTPKDGIRIGHRYIPGDVTICTPFWALHRSPKCFVQPHHFLPERWLNRSDLVLRKDAYIPFGHGAYACIGKQLALMELRLTLAKLILEFDIRFADGEDGHRLLEESKDWFTFGLADMMLDFSPRGG